MTSLLDVGVSILAAQPFSALLGTEMVAYGVERVELRLPLDSRLLQQHGFAHGGVIAYLADNALSFAAGAAMGGGVVTSEIKLNYVRPAVGEVLIARAHAVSAGKSQAVARCEIYVLRNGDERLCAVGQGAVTKINSKSQDAQQHEAES